MPRPIWLLICAALLAFPSPLFAQGRLEHIREKVAGIAPDSHKSHALDNTFSLLPHTDDPEFNTELLVVEAVAVGIVPLYLIYGVFSTVTEQQSFTRYPYAIDETNYVKRGQASASGGNDLQWWSTQVSVEDGNYSGLNRAGSRLIVDTTSGIGISTNWNRFDEGIGHGALDSTTIGDMNLHFCIIDADSVLLRVGAGARVMTDRQRTDWGFNVFTGGDLMVGKPLIVSSQLDMGSLGNAFVLHARITAGLIWNRFEAFAGYDLLRIGTFNLQEPMIGLRVWF